MFKVDYQNASVATLRLEDIPEILDIQLVTNLAFWSEKDYAEVFSSRDYHCLTIKINSEVKGFIITRLIILEYLLEIINIAVLPEMQNSGLGQRLLAESINFSRDNNLKSILLEVRRSNLNGMAFYQKNGFAVLGERRDFYSNPPEDALLMRLDLKKLD